VTVTIEDGRYGRRAALRAPWSPEMGALLESERVVELELNSTAGRWG
jgi:hypothetical protein